MDVDRTQTTVLTKPGTSQQTGCQLEHPNFHTSGRHTITLLFGFFDALLQEFQHVGNGLFCSGVSKQIAVSKQKGGGC